MEFFPFYPHANVISGVCRRVCCRAEVNGSGGGGAQAVSESENERETLGSDGDQAMGCGGDNDRAMGFSDGVAATSDPKIQAKSAIGALFFFFLQK